METLLVGPFILFAIAALYQVKKKGRQWPDILLGVFGGLVIAAMFQGIDMAVYTAAEGFTNAVAQVWSSVSP